MSRIDVPYDFPNTEFHSGDDSALHERGRNVLGYGGIAQKHANSSQHTRTFQDDEDVDF